VKELLKRHDEIVLIIENKDLEDLRDIAKFNVSSFTDILGNKKYSVVEVCLSGCNS
jgi:hypothetical protein